MSEQLEMFRAEVAELTPQDVTALIDILRRRGWQTRQQLSTLTEWSPRQIRKLVEMAGSDIVRGPKGFNYFDSAETVEIEHAAAIAESQGEKMLSYAKSLRARLLGRIATA